MLAENLVTRDEDERSVLQHVHPPVQEGPPADGQHFRLYFGYKRLPYRKPEVAMKTTPKLLSEVFRITVL